MPDKSASHFTGQVGVACPAGGGEQAPIWNLHDSEPDRLIRESGQTIQIFRDFCEVSFIDNDLI